MPWTESRSREEWLAEVRQRGERIRRRRRFTIAAVAVFALVLPMSAVAGFLTAGPDGSVRLTAAGRGPAAERPATPTTETDVVDTTSTAPKVTAPAEEPRPTARESPTTTIEVHGRAAVINGSTEPRPAASAPAADDPVVRAPSTAETVPPSSRSGGAAGAPVSTANSGSPVVTSPPPADQSLAACPFESVRVTVVTDKATYAPGEVISGSSTLENRSATACLLPTRANFRIWAEAGFAVGSFATSTELREAVKAEPGKTFISGFTWDQRDCAGACVQVPAGSYEVVAMWTEQGSYGGYNGVGWFRIGA